AVEKNLDAFLSLDLPGSKAIIGRGPEEERLARQYPNTTFFGSLSDENLAAHLAAADVFVFPSRTDTYGVVQLEALACGVPVAAFPVTGPIDVIADDPVGALNENLRAACLEALTMSKQACRDFALTRSWDNSARQFIGNVSKVATGTFAASRAA
ncbi:MAG: glycosyltransferase, partial [Pseudorhodoplanes sp.]|nr:glycosyltransferase [Pseudorhodoplanes sp.]